MKKSLLKISDFSRINKTAIGCNVVLSVIIVLAYLAEVFKGSRTIPYFCIVTVVAFLPIVLEGILYKRNPESRGIQYVMGIGYGVLYLLAIFTTNSLLPFTYAIPMFIVIPLFGNLRYSILLGAGYVLLNAANVIYIAVTAGYTKEQIPDVEIRLILMVLVCLYVCLTSNVTVKINKRKQDELQEEKGKVETLLNNVMKISGEITEGIKYVNSHMEQLGNSVLEIRDSMQEVSGGTAETAESVQNQLIRTEEIGKHIDKVRNAANNIVTDMEIANQEIEAGKQNTDSLFIQVGESQKANDEVAKQIEDLKEQTEKMNSITEMIRKVANSTSMLALNASIEAARAGESGKGFAVVASQISALATQTKDATINIVDLIQEISRELNDVILAVEDLNENNRKQTEAVDLVVESFKRITDSANSVSTSAVSMEDVVRELVEANSGIVESIQTISAITEEVSAHSNETCESCESNSDIVSEVTEIVSKLNENAVELQKMQN